MFQQTYLGILSLYDTGTKKKHNFSTIQTAPNNLSPPKTINQAPLTKHTPLSPFQSNGVSAPAGSAELTDSTNNLVPNLHEYLQPDHHLQQQQQHQLTLDSMNGESGSPRYLDLDYPCGQFPVALGPDPYSLAYKPSPRSTSPWDNQPQQPQAQPQKPTYRCEEHLQRYPQRCRDEYYHRCSEGNLWDEPRRGCYPEDELDLQKFPQCYSEDPLRPTTTSQVRRCSDHHQQQQQQHRILSPGGLPMLGHAAIGLVVNRFGSGPLVEQQRRGIEMQQQQQQRHYGGLQLGGSGVYDGQSSGGPFCPCEAGQGGSVGAGRDMAGEYLDARYVLGHELSDSDDN